MTRGEDRPRLICRCLGVASPRVYTAVRAQGLTRVAAVTKAVRAGGGCGLCHPELEEVIAEVHGAPVDPGLAIENRVVCREETRSRVTAVLEGLVRPHLARLGIALARYEIEDLRVRLRLEGAAGAEGLAAARDALQRSVCPDLAVEPL